MKGADIARLQTQRERGIPRVPRWEGDCGWSGVSPVTIKQRGEMHVHVHTEPGSSVEKKIRSDIKKSSIGH